MSTPIVLGIDVGTSDSKILATTPTGIEIGSVSIPTLWRNHGGIYTDADPEVLISRLFSLLERAVEQAVGRVGPVSVDAIAVTGMAEAGVLLDEQGAAAHPIIAWFDPRGGAEMLGLPTQILDEFCGRTGLPVSALATIAKLAWMRGQGTVLRGRQWLGVPEFVVHRLGGVRVSEMSLVARTGLLDQDSSDLWPEALAAIDADASLVPPRVVAGTPLGRAGGPSVPAVLRGAVLTVAGHDHPVAAVGCGTVGADEVFDSFGTAEALVRSMPGTLDRAARERLASAGVNVVHHVLAGRRVLLGGTKAGLLLRRTLDLLGAGAGTRRTELDQAACTLQDAIAAGDSDLDGIRVRGAANDDGTLHIDVTTDQITPAAMWLATVANGIDEAARCLELMAAEIGPADAVVVAGGWTRMNSVRRAKSESSPRTRFSDRSQAGAFGATMFAAYAATVADRLASNGDPSANSVRSPHGPSEAFAARYTQAVGATPSARTLEEIAT